MLFALISYVVSVQHNEPERYCEIEDRGRFLTLHKMRQISEEITQVVQTISQVSLFSISL